MRQPKLGGIWVLVFLTMAILSTVPDKAGAETRLRGENNLRSDQGLENTTPFARQETRMLYASAPLDTRGQADSTRTGMNSDATPRVTIGVVKRIQCKESCNLTLSVAETGKTLILFYLPESVKDANTFKRKFSGARVKVSWHGEKKKDGNTGSYRLINVVDQIELLP